MASEYRIVKDQYCGFEVQKRRWWFPFWLSAGCNTHSTLEKAEEYAEGHARNYVKYLGRLVNN